MKRNGRRISSPLTLALHIASSQSAGRWAYFGRSTGGPLEQSTDGLPRETNELANYYAAVVYAAKLLILCKFPPFGAMISRPPDDQLVPLVCLCDANLMQDQNNIFAPSSSYYWCSCDCSRELKLNSFACRRACTDTVKRSEWCENQSVSSAENLPPPTERPRVGALGSASVGAAKFKLTT